MNKIEIYQERKQRILSLVGGRIREGTGAGEILDVDFIFLQVEESEAFFLDIQG